MAPSGCFVLGSSWTEGPPYPGRAQLPSLLDPITLSSGFRNCLSLLLRHNPFSVTETHRFYVKIGTNVLGREAWFVGLYIVIIYPTL